MVQYKKPELNQMGESAAPAVLVACSASSGGGTKQRLTHRYVCRLCRADDQLCGDALVKIAGPLLPPPSFKQHSGHYSKLTNKESY